ncbi:MAG: hypothetical protein V3S21_02630, partial [Xanthomonadales bacterium]
VLIIVILLVVAWWPEPPTPAVEETFIGPQIRTLNKVKDFEQDYLDALDQKKKEMDRQVDGGR